MSFGQSSIHWKRKTTKESRALKASDAALASAKMCPSRGCATVAALVGTPVESLRWFAPRDRTFVFARFIENVLARYISFVRDRPLKSVLPVRTGPVRRL